MGTIVSPERPERSPTMGPISPPFIRPMPPERRTWGAPAHASQNWAIHRASQPGGGGGGETCASFVMIVDLTQSLVAWHISAHHPHGIRLSFLQRLVTVTFFPEKPPTTPSRNLYVSSRCTDGFPHDTAIKPFTADLLWDGWTYREMAIHVSTATSEVSETLLLCKMIGARNWGGGAHAS